MKESFWVLIALGAAVVLGIAVGASGSASLVHAADFLAPLGTLWVNAIRMTVIPLVVSILITGVASAADVRAIGRLGARTLTVFVLLLGGVACFVVPLAPLVVARFPRGAVRPPLPEGAAEAAGQLTSAPSQTLAAWIGSL